MGLHTMMTRVISGKMTGLTSEQADHSVGAVEVTTTEWSKKQA